MAKYFLGSVGAAEAFKKVGNDMTLAFVSKTLTDSAVNVTITKDELRGGTNAPVVTNFYHDPAVAITLTDIMFKEDYVSAQLGATWNGLGAAAYQTESFTATEASYTLTKTAVALPVVCDVASAIIAWYTIAGEDDWTKATVTGNAIGGLTSGKKYCVRYLATDASAKDAIVNSQIIPSELFLIITVPLFAGDACSASQGKVAGSLTFEVPRFQLDGGQEFAFNMSSNTTMNLSGTALAVEDGCDVNNSKLFRLIEVITGRSYTTDLVGVMFANEDSAHVGDVPEVYAVYKDRSVALLPNDVTGITFTPALTDGAFATAGSQKVEFSTFEDTITVLA